jgi:vancomycin permeability regulator SanA
VPHKKVGLVLGAGVLPDGTPTPYLQGRIQAAVELYKAGRVDVLLMSGDNSTKHHNEPTVMKKYAVELGIPAAKVYMDYAGFSTYDSCYRAKEIFGVNEAIVVSQGYHTPRAVFTCQKLGIDAVGVAAMRTSRDYTAAYVARELLAVDKAMFEVTLKPKPTHLGPQEFID